MRSLKFRGEVTRLNLHPNDQVEWMPFLQAAAMSGDVKLVKQISTRINVREVIQTASLSKSESDGWIEA